MDDLTSAPGIVATAAVILALAALLGCLLLRRRLAALREAQRVVMGDGRGRDLIGHADELERRLAELGVRMEESVGRLEESDAKLGSRLDGAVTHCGVVRYDAMGEMTGRQSSSVALLDSFHSGVVLSSILHREQARLYAKQITSGQSELELSPEEREALELALDDQARR